MKPLTAEEAKAAANYVRMAMGQMKHRAPRERARVIAEKLEMMGRDRSQTVVVPECAEKPPAISLWNIHL